MKQNLKDFAREMKARTEQENKRTGASAYQVIGTALDNCTTLELAKWYIDNLGESALRYYLEQQITGAVINDIKDNQD